MSAVAILTAIEASNALLSLIVNASVTLQKVNSALQTAQTTGQPIPKETWDAIVADADSADQRLADALKNAVPDSP